jgi:phosphoserine phosphatase
MMSVLSQQLNKLQLSIGGVVVSAVKDVGTVVGAEVVGRLPGAASLGQRILGNPRVKAWLKKQTPEVQAAAKTLVTAGWTAILASAALESIVKDLSRK